MLEGDERQQDHECGEDGDYIHADAYGHADDGGHPDAGGGGETFDGSLHVYHGATAQETDAGDDLRCDTARIAVLKAEVDLRHVYGEEHGEAGSHGDERECTDAGYLALALALGADNHT